MKALIIGDVHGNFKRLENIKLHYRPDLIIQCGDFGVWPRHTHEIKGFDDCPIYFCRGNHEWHDVLDAFPRTNNPIELTTPIEFESNFSVDFSNASNVFLMNTGSVLTINGKNILFLGGGLSIDQAYRTIGTSWWPQESMSDEEFNAAKEVIINNKIDIVISHVAPQYIVEKYRQVLVMYEAKMSDETSYKLNDLYELMKETNNLPTHWYFAHYHTFTHIIDNDINFICCDELISLKNGNIHVFSLEDNHEQNNNDNNSSPVEVTKEDSTSNKEV